MPGSYAILFFIALGFTFTPDTSITGCCFFFDSASSLFLELFLGSSLVAYWTPTNLGGSSNGVISFCLFILLMGFSRQEYWSCLPLPSSVDHILLELSTVIHLFWVTLSPAWLITSLSYIRSSRRMCTHLLLWVFGSLWQRCGSTVACHSVRSTGSSSPGKNGVLALEKVTLDMETADSRTGPTLGQISEKCWALGGAVQEQGSGSGIGSGCPWSSRGYARALRNQGDVLASHHSALCSLLRELNMEAVLDIIVTGIGSHLANHNVNAGLRFHVSFHVKLYFGRCCIWPLEVKHCPHRVIEGQQRPGSTPLVCPDY